MFRFKQPPTDHPVRRMWFTATCFHPHYYNSTTKARIGNEGRLMDPLNPSPHHSRPLQMPPYLAAEITDCIIGFVWPDKRGLCACSLVCQDWLPASRHHLFSNITTSPTSYDMLVEQLNHSSSMRACLPSVHTFAFQAPLAVKPSDDLSIAMANWTKGQRFILDFSGHLPNLRRAEFMATFFHTKMHPRLHLALHNFRKLRELSLAYCHFSSFNSLRRMLVALPGLASLTMRFLAWTSISFPSVPTATRPPAQASPALEHLSLALKAYDIPDPDSLIDWLISIPTPSRISLSMVGFQAYGNVEPPYGALRFMNCLSSPSSVRDLTISQFEIEGEPSRIELLPLRPSLTNSASSFRPSLRFISSRQSREPGSGPGGRSLLLAATSCAPLGRPLPDAPGRPEPPPPSSPQCVLLRTGGRRCRSKRARSCLRQRHGRT